MDVETVIYLTNTIICAIIAVLMTEAWHRGEHRSSLLYWMIAAWVMLVADMLFAALVDGGLPEQCLGRMGEAPGRQTTRRQANPRQHPIRIGTAGTQGVYHGAHQRHVVSQVAHVERFLLCARRGHLRQLWATRSRRESCGQPIDWPAARAGMPANADKSRPTKLLPPF